MVTGKLHAKFCATGSSGLGTAAPNTCGYPNFWKFWKVFFKFTWQFLHLFVWAYPQNFGIKLLYIRGNYSKEFWPGFDKSSKKNHESKKGGNILDMIFQFFDHFSQNTELSFEPCGFSSELAFLGCLCKISVM